MVGTVAECSTAALRVAGSIPSWKKKMYGIHLVVPVWSFVYLSLNVCKRIHDTGITTRTGKRIKKDLARKNCS